MGDESPRSWAARYSAVTGDAGDREKRECELWPWRQDARGGSWTGSGRCTRERKYLVLVSPDTPGSQEENLVRTVAPAVQGQTKKGSRCVATA